MGRSSPSRILIVGPTGNLGQHLVEASISAGHPTFALSRHSAFDDPNKSLLLRSFAQKGVTLLKGCLEDFDSLLEAVGKVHVVVSAVSSKQVSIQKLLVRAIKKAGSVKRFLPAEFGADPDRSQIADLDRGFYAKKAEIRRMIEKEGIPHNYVCCNYFMRHFLRSLAQPGLDAPPMDKVRVYGDGDTKAVFVTERDVAMYTICTVDDERSLNKTVHLRPPGNVCSMHDLVRMWETKIGKKLRREYVTGEQLREEIIHAIIDNPEKSNNNNIMGLVFIYSAFVKGDHTYFDIDPSSGIDGAQIYGSIVKHTTVDEYLTTLLCGMLC